LKLLEALVAQVHRVRISPQGYTVEPGRPHCSGRHGQCRTALVAPEPSDALLGIGGTRQLVVEPREYCAPNQAVEERVDQPDYAADGSDCVTTVQPAD